MACCVLFALRISRMIKTAPWVDIHAQVSIQSRVTGRENLHNGMSSGQIEFPEFVEMMRDRFGALEYREMCIKDAFQTLDKDKNGYITYDELRAAMLEKGEPLDD
ncbi:hypothetical protein BaRGS_00025633 [Batillaria attramentaria]|uniref:EF-hand domain-containing protein n=1 Tax=Batillaria attramentaria TaxID=370345 RepID=A0ABD0K7V7_9CAEN